MSNDFLAELDKIANFSTDVLAPDDVSDEQMVPDTAPHVAPETVEQLQTANAEVPQADEQLPGNPEADKELAEAIRQAQEEYESAQQHLAGLEEEREELEKAANEMLPAMGALARLIHFSTDDSISANLQKLASERLRTAMIDDESFQEIIEKTAGEMFVDEENIQQLHSDEGRSYVLEHLASFAEDDESLEKVAFEVGGVLSQAQRIAGDYVEGARNLWKMDEQINAARTALDAAKEVATQKTEALEAAAQNPNFDPTERQKINDEYSKSTDDFMNASDEVQRQEGLKNKGMQVWGTGAALGAGGAFMGGKAIANAVKSHHHPEEELSEKSASVTIELGNKDHIKGGTIPMSTVKDFLKLAGAAGLLDIANDENQPVSFRKEAAETFNSISRMNRFDMEANFEKMATTIYSEDALHQIVAGQHNDFLFNKIAYFTELENLSADELEKVAGADGVAAKGVAGALTDAKSNIEAKLEQDKNHTETVKNGEIGTRKPDDMRGYNVINNPAAYKVDKTASSIFEEAQMQKEAAYRAFVEADTFLKLNGIN